jgi:hypothetical protein
VRVLRASILRMQSLKQSLTRLMAVQELKDNPPPIKSAPVTNASSPIAKVTLFGSLFRGREDVHRADRQNGHEAKRAAMQRVDDAPAADERVLIATGRYIGEGFDDARLDTRFLAMPIAWKVTLAQCGRLELLRPGTGSRSDSIPVVPWRDYHGYDFRRQAFADRSGASEQRLDLAQLVAQLRFD